MLQNLLLAMALGGFDPLNPHTFDPLTGTLSIDNGGEGGGGSNPGEGGEGEGGGGDDRTFTQSEVDRIVAGRLAKESKKFSDYDQLREQASRVSELESKLQSLSEEKELAGKTAAEKAQHAHQKELRQLERKIEELSGQAQEKEQLAQTARQRWESDKISSALERALMKGEALPRAIPQAASLLANEAKARVEEDAEGNVRVLLEVDGVELDPESAAQEWLKRNDHFAKAPGGGAGTRSGGSKLPGNMAELPSRVLLADALRNPPTK
ncbi:MAG: hypothetical protein RID81_07125 [Sandaracinaceae bacterium]